MDVARAARATAQIQPEQLFMETPPIVFDEWQEIPELWNLVRRAVNDHEGKGLYILTGSARPRDNARMHSGADRIGRLRMRPMSLFETRHSSGQISLKRFLIGEDPSGRAERLTIHNLLERIVIGGWPDLLDATERAARTWLRDYLRNVAEVDVPGMGLRRNPANIERLLTSLGRSAATPLNLTALARDVGRATGSGRIRNAVQLPRRFGQTDAGRSDSSLAAAHEISNPTPHNTGQSLRGSFARGIGTRSGS